MKTCLINAGLPILGNLPKITTVLALFLFLLVPGRATTWYVETAAAAGGTGTAQKPFQTIAQGMAKAVSGDTVDVEYGTYYETVTPKSGVTVEGNPGNHVTISAFKSLSPTAPTNPTTWTTYTGTTVAPAGDVYTTPAVPLKVRDLYGRYNTREPLSRYPAADSPWLDVSSYNSSTGVITLSTPVGITLSSLQSTFVFIFITKLEGYFPYYISNISSDGTQITITGGNSDAADMAAGDRLIICNNPQLIKNPGDWAYVDNGNSTTALFWYPSAGSTGIDYAETNSAEYGIHCNGVTNVLITGLEVMGATLDGILVYGSSGVTVQNCSVHDNGFGYTYGGDGILSRSSTNTTIQDCLVYDNAVGLGSLDDTGFTMNQTEDGFDDNDGVDIGVDVSNNTNPTVENCWLHNHTAISHADNLQFQSFPNATTYTMNATIANNFFDIGGQDIMSQYVNGVTATNNVFMESGARGVILGHGNSTNFALDNNTFGMTWYTATSPDEVGTTGQYNILNCVFYEAQLDYGGENTSNYNLFWNGNYFICESQTFKKYYGTTTPNLTQCTIDTGYEANSTAANPAFTNMPTYFGYISSQLWSSTTTKVTVDGANGSAVGAFAVGDVVEMDGDGVARKIQTSSVTGDEATITFTPALPNTPIRALSVRDWPAGTTNLVIDTTPQSGSPALTGSNTNGQRGSTIDPAQYAAGSFDGTGNRNIPTQPADTYYGAYNLYPYNGIVP